MRTHLMIPDCQVTPNTPTDHLDWIGRYITEKRPDVIVQIGDFADLPSLSTYKSQREAEGMRLEDDLQAARDAMRVLMRPIKRFNARKRYLKEKQYQPELHLTLGNHEYRLQRYIDANPALEGVLDMYSFGYEEHGWEVSPFLDIKSIDGVSYSHYFANPNTGKPYGGESVETRLKNIGFSFTMGHQQTLKSGQRFLSNGRRIRGLIAGSCYLHDEHYRKQSNSEWRGIIVKHEVRNGQYDLMEVSLDKLCRKYEGCHVWEFMRDRYPHIYSESAWMRQEQ